MFMTIEEKFDKAIEFIRSIENMKYDVIDAQDIVDDATIYCENCEEECTSATTESKAEYVNAEVFDELKAKCWHVLADLTW